MQYIRGPDDNQVNKAELILPYGRRGGAGPHPHQDGSCDIRCKLREEKVMAAGRCDICERKPMYGNNVPFSQHRTRRRFVLNVHRRRLEINGTTKTVNICTRCLRTLSKLPKVRK